MSEHRLNVQEIACNAVQRGATLQRVAVALPVSLQRNATHPFRGCCMLQRSGFDLLLNLKISARCTGRVADGANAQISASKANARFSAERIAMRTSPETAINDLLARWHRWSSAPARVADTRMVDFDGVLVLVPPKLRIALQVQAMNLAGGAAVWSSVRAGDINDARARLRALLAEDPTRWFGPAEVKLNERGNRIGDSNPKADLSDHEVDLLLELRDQGYTYAWLAEKFGIAKSTVGSWCTGRTRGQAAVRTKKVE